MDLQKEARKDIEIITRVTGLTQGEISTRAGYAEQTLTQMISSGDISPRMLKNIRREFKDVLNNSIEEELPRIPAVKKKATLEGVQQEKPSEVEKSLFTLSDANRESCRANVILAENQKELITILNRVTAGAVKGTGSERKLTFLEAYYRMLQLGVEEGRWKSTDEGQAKLDSVIRGTTPKKTE